MISHNENVKQVFFACKYTINKTILNILLVLFLQSIQDFKTIVYA